MIEFGAQLQHGFEQLVHGRFALGLNALSDVSARRHPDDEIIRGAHSIHIGNPVHRVAVAGRALTLLRCPSEGFTEGPTAGRTASVGSWR